MALKIAKTLDTSGTYSTSGVAIDEDLMQTYSKDAVEYAIKLKAKYGNKYSDGYYLDYAKKHVLKEIIGAHREFYKNMKYSYEIQDKEWAGYTYEEIIEMENNGYKIPEDILQWAHAQQQSDVTAYVMISEDAQTETDTTEEATGDNSLDSIKAKATKYITQTDQAQKETDQLVEQYKATSKQANDIKQEKGDSYEESLNNLTKLANEWKELDQKNKNGTLSGFERIKYKFLGNLLNSEDGKIMSNIQQDTATLDEFLNTLDSLNTKIDKNLELSQNTIQAGLELSNFDKNYNDNNEPYVNTGIVVKGSGLLSDSLYGVFGDEVAKLAILKGHDLEDNSNQLSTTLKIGFQEDLATFASSYSTLATSTQEKIKVTMGETDNESSENDEEETKKSEDEANKALKNQKNYDVSTDISYVNSLNSTVTTIKATADLVSQNRSTRTSAKTLAKELSKANNENKKLLSKAANVEQKQEANIQQEDTILAELEMLQEEQNNASLATQTSGQNGISGTPQGTTQQPIIVNFENNNNDNTTNISESLTQIDAIEAQNTSEKESLQKDVAQNVKTISKAQKSSKDLDTNNTSLKKLSTNVQQVSGKTMFVGSGTVALGIVDTTLSTSMISAGLTMMATPFTYNAGLVMTIAGNLLQQKAIKEQTFGAGAIVSGIAGLVASENANSDSQDSDTTLKSANANIKDNNNSIKDVQSVAGTTQTTGQTDTGNTGNTQSETNNQANSQAQTGPVNVNFVDETSEVNTNNNQQDISATNQNQQATVNNEAQVEETSQVTQTTQETQDTESTQETQDVNNESQNNNKDNKNDSVAVGFGLAYAVAAAATNTKSTNELKNMQSEISSSDGTIAGNIKKMKDIVKNADKDAVKAQTEKQLKDQQIQNITAQIDAAKTQMQSAETEDAVISSQTQVENLSAELEAAGADGEQVTEQLDKTLANGTQQLSVYQKSTQGLNSDLATFESKIANQLDVSQNTMVVGIGTSALGVTNSVMGSSLISSGVAMMATPFTFQAGVIQVGIGQALLAKGISETSSGSVAAVIAANGLVANSSAQKAMADAQATVKSSNAENTSATKDLESNATKVDTTDVVDNANLATDAGMPQEIEIRANEDIQNTTEDTGIIAASASANTNTSSQTTADDTTASVKLERFNTDSIIESKRKKKKVVAVSASAKG